MFRGTSHSHELETARTGHVRRPEIRDDDEASRTSQPTQTWGPKRMNHLAELATYGPGMGRAVAEIATIVALHDGRAAIQLYVRIISLDELKIPLA